MTTLSVAYVSDRRAAKVVPAEASELLQALARAAHDTRAVPSQDDVDVLADWYQLAPFQVRELIAFAAEDHRQQAIA